MPNAPATVDINMRGHDGKKGPENELFVNILFN